MSANLETISIEPGNTRGWPKSKKQLDFALYYIRDGMVATEAMRKAGYAEATARFKVSYTKKVLGPFLAFLQEKKNEVAAKNYDVTTDRVLREMAAIGLQNWKDFVRIVHVDKVPRLIGRPLNELTDLQALAVENWEAVEIEADEGVVMDYQYVLHDKTTALVNLGRHLGMFSEKLMLELNMRDSQKKSIDFSAMPQDELENVIGVLEEIQERAAKARAIEGTAERIS